MDLMERYLSLLDEARQTVDHAIEQARSAREAARAMDLWEDVGLLYDVITALHETQARLRRLAKAVSQPR